MSNKNKLVAIGVGTTIGRCLMGVGCGLFVRKALYSGRSLAEMTGVDGLNDTTKKDSEEILEEMET